MRALICQVSCQGANIILLGLLPRYIVGKCCDQRDREKSKEPGPHQKGREHYRPGQSDPHGPEHFVEKSQTPLVVYCSAPPRKLLPRAARRPKQKENPGHLAPMQLLANLSGKWQLLRLIKFANKNLHKIITKFEK